MSMKLVSAAFAVEGLPASQKAVLVALADQADKMGRCWPAVSSLVRRTGWSVRSVQNALKALAEADHVSRRKRTGTSSIYVVHPRSDCTPKGRKARTTGGATAAPPKSLHPSKSGQSPPQEVTVTPAAAAPKSSRTIKNHQLLGKRKSALSTKWNPESFGAKTKSAAVVARWSADELAAQVEQFRAHHTAKGSRFVDWQAAWSTWVLNSRAFTPRKSTPGRLPAEEDRPLYELLEERRS